MKAEYAVQINDMFLGDDVSFRVTNTNKNQFVATGTIIAALPFESDIFIFIENPFGVHKVKLEDVLNFPGTKGKFQ